MYVDLVNHMMEQKYFKFYLNLKVRHRIDSSGAVKIRTLQVMPLVLDMFVTLAEDRSSLTCTIDASFLSSGPCMTYFQGTALSLL